PSITADAAERFAIDNLGIYGPGTSYILGGDACVTNELSYDCSDIGSHTVTYVATDAYGNTGTCEATITVVDNQPPVVSCQDLTVEVDLANDTTITADQIELASSDNCDTDIALSLSQATFNCADLGTNVITLTASDDTPNTATCTATVTVESPGIDNEDFYITAGVDEGSCLVAREEVVWTDLNNLTATGNDLDKTSGGNSWNGGAASYNRVYNNGYMEFTVPQNNLDMVIGLSNTNANADRSQIQFGIYLRNDGLYRARENGSDVGPGTTAYAVGDVFRIAVEGNEVKYYRNGAIFYESGNAPTLPLLVDVSLQDVGAEVHDVIVANGTDGTFTATVADPTVVQTFQWQRNASNEGTNSASYTPGTLNGGDVVQNILTINNCASDTYNSNNITIETRTLDEIGDVYISAGVDEDACLLAIENVVWTDMNYLEQTGDTLRKYYSSSWNGGAASYNAVYNNGYFEFVVAQTDRDMVIGLSTTNGSNDRSDIQYGVYLRSDGDYRARESGSDVGPGVTAYAVGDTFRIAVQGNEVFYYRNGNIFYQSGNTPTLPLIVDISMQDVGGAIYNAVVANGTDGSFTVNNPDGLTITDYDWMLDGANVGTNSNAYTNTTLTGNHELYTDITLSGCGTVFPTDTVYIESRPLDEIGDVFVTAGYDADACVRAIEQVTWTEL
ncbi:MAG: HYR domain-containing protein, partial [Bacteroidota bacterium]